ncbi:MAG: hypothetical protein CBHOC_0223 [uncultured Caballeronia sp.]|nr:MAG: hypothetical protein CBHOC_0223 [uncultured Caballeronia sp.]
MIAPSIYRLLQFADLFDCPIGALFGEHSAAAREDARAISALIGDLPREDRQIILRFVADFAKVVRERDAERYRGMARERDELLEAVGGVGRKRRQPKRPF